MAGVEAQGRRAENVHARLRGERLRRGVGFHQFAEQPIGGGSFLHPVGVRIVDDHIAAEARFLRGDFQIVLQQNGRTGSDHDNQFGMVVRRDLAQRIGQAHAATGQIVATYDTSGHRRKVRRALKHRKERSHVIIALGGVENRMDVPHRVHHSRNAVVGGTLIHPIGQAHMRIPK